MLQDDGLYVIQNYGDQEFSISKIFELANATNFRISCYLPHDVDDTTVIACFNSSRLVFTVVRDGLSDVYNIELTANHTKCIARVLDDVVHVIMFGDSEVVTISSMIGDKRSIIKKYGVLDYISLPESDPHDFKFVNHSHTGMWYNSLYVVAVVNNNVAYLVDWKGDCVLYVDVGGFGDIIAVAMLKCLVILARDGTLSIVTGSTTHRLADIVKFNTVENRGDVDSYLALRNDDVLVKISVKPRLKIKVLVEDIKNYAIDNLCNYLLITHSDGSSSIHGLTDFVNGNNNSVADF